MKVNKSETLVAVAATDGFRYVGVEPPLTDSEISAIRADGVIEAGFSVQQIRTLEPACTMITVSGVRDPFRNPDARTEYAHSVAEGIASVLSRSRDCQVRHDPSTSWIVGYLSSPFNPDTDSMRT